MHETDDVPGEARRERPRFKAPRRAVEDAAGRAGSMPRRALGGLALLGAGAVAGIGIAQVDDAASATAICCKGGSPLHGALLGRDVVDDGGRRGAGDPDGRASTAAVLRGKLCFGLTVKDIDTPMGAHIHRGAVGRNGPVVVTLRAPRTGNPGASSGCATVPDSVIRAIRANPRRYYWQIHTRAYPDGALRGQLFTQRGGG